MRKNSTDKFINLFECIQLMIRVVITFNLWNIHWHKVTDYDNTSVNVSQVKDYYNSKYVVDTLEQI